MNGTLGRDKIWNDQIWSRIDQAVQEEVGRARVAQKVFSSTVVHNVQPVPTNRTVPFGPPAAPAAGPIAAPDDDFRPFFEISREFVLTGSQVEAEENVRLAASLARLAASAISNAEDTILFLGAPFIPAGVNVTNRPAIPQGFSAEARNFGAVNVPGGARPNVLAGIALGMAQLNSRDQPGPYALFVPPTRYAQTFGPAARGMLQTPGDEIKQIVTGGYYMVNCLEPPAGAPPVPLPDAGILVSLGGEPTKIILGCDATVAFTSIDGSGNYHFRVFERIQMVVRDGRSFQTLQF
jgi:hypothetical protein